MKTLKVLTIVGARPQFVKASAISRELRKQYTEILVHTGQHYDYGMSESFFNQLDIPQPDINLGIGSGSHSVQTGAMLTGLEQAILDHNPNWVLVYGDTNSTLAGSLTAAKLHIPICHVEAGLRSFNRRMPEEVNRVVTDHLSSLLFCPSEVSVRNLFAEGITDGVHEVGDVMADVLKRTLDKGRIYERDVLGRYKVTQENYLLVTVHRAENTDNPERLQSILDALAVLAKDESVLFPVHPRTLKAIGSLKTSNSDSMDIDNIQFIEPIPYMDMALLVSRAKAVLTDSGGLQKETYWMKTPCITLRDETEWEETVDTGWNHLVGADAELIVKKTQAVSVPDSHPLLYGDAHAAERCVKVLSETVY